MGLNNNSLSHDSEKEILRLEISLFCTIEWLNNLKK